MAMTEKQKSDYNAKAQQAYDKVQGLFQAFDNIPEEDRPEILTGDDPTTKLIEICASVAYENCLEF